MGSRKPAVLSRARCSPRLRRPVVGRPHGLSAGAADRFAIDRERVHDVGHDAPALRALRPLHPVMDDSSVAVVESGSTPPTVAVHGPFIAPTADNSRMPRSGGRWLSPAEFVQAVVMDAEVVGDLV